MKKDKDEAQKQLDAIGIRPGQHYRHYKGGEYVIVTCAIKEDTLEVLIIYRSLDKGSMWARTLQSWDQEVENAGKKIKRFEKIY